MEVAQGQDWWDFGLLILKVVGTAGGYCAGNNSVSSLLHGKSMERDESGGKNQTGICYRSSKRSQQVRTFAV